jgi:class 3 adenylate cyclase/ligand-binding sensor domain-containing protein
VRVNLKIFLLILLLIFTADYYAQTLSFTQFTTDDGLPQNSVYSIIQDHNDFLWFATEEGVSKFDGTEFVNYSVKDGLPYNHVRVIFEDADSNIWFGTNQGLGVLYSDSARIVAVADTTVLPLMKDFVYSIAQSRDSTVFFATGTSGLFYLRNNEFHKAEIKNVRLPDSLLYVYVDPENTLWLGTAKKGLWKAENCEINRLHRVGFVKQKRIIKLYRDKRGNLWVSGSNGSFILRGKKVSPLSFLGSATAAFFFEDLSGKIWIGTENDGVFVYDAGEVENYRQENGLSGNSLLSGIEDKRGDIWFGFRDGGVSRLPIEKFIIYNKENGLANNAVFGIFKDRWSRLWFGHWLSGVTLYFRNQSKILTDKDGIPGNGAAAFIQPNPVDVYIGAIKGISIYRNGSVQDSIRLFPEDNNDYVLSFLKNSDSVLYVGTTDGMRFFSLKQKKFLPENPKWDTLKDSWVQHIFKDFDGNVCVTTDPKGVFFFRGDSLVKTLTKKNGLLSNTVFWALQNEKGDYWFFTDVGINIYNGEKCTSIKVDDGLPANTCYFGVEEGDYIFVGTPQGVARIDYVNYERLKKDAIKIYTKKDGFAGTEMNMFGVFKDKRGNLFFASQNGVTQLNPNEKPRQFPSATYIRNVKIITEEAEIDTVPRTQMNLAYYMNNITIDYRGVVFTDPDKIFYRYKLEGIDKSWTETKEHTITYRALPPGTYVFRVRCRNQDGIWSNKDATVSFIITPPFWDTWWFRTLFVLVLISGAYGMYIYKTQQVRKRNLELAKLVRERTKELQEEKDKTDELIHNILPAQAVVELKTKGYVEPRLFESVTILFTDFKDFTVQASNLPPGELVDELNKIFLEFDNIIEEFGLEKLKTIGDAYMAASGLPQITDDHAERVVRAALKMQEFIKSNQAFFRVKWKMRAGVHTGTVVAGVVGSKKFTYDIWGDTVNIASRMESSGVPGFVNVSASTYELIKDKFVCQYRGKVDAKGKGKMDMYLVLREK